MTTATFGTKVVCLLAWMGLVVTTAFAQQTKPNIVYILADDLGYGDVKAFNPQCKIATPNIDRLTREGMMFTDAHSGSAVCTPTRYGILTGRYSWRSRLQNGVLGGLSPRLIEDNRMTVASFLKAQGYHTAALGKWHLGMDWVKVTGKNVNENGIENEGQNRSVDFSKPIAGGPTAVGFDYFYGIAASLDMVPYTFIENDKVTALPTEDRAFVMMPGQKGNTRRGPAAPGFEAVDVLPAVTKKAVEQIASRAADAKAGKPFFIYMPLNAPHTPTLPNKDFEGKSGLNAYGDFVMQTDATLGAVMKALDDAGVADNTILIFTSDNGCSPQAQFPDLAAKGHNPSHVFRGHKADIYEGGHRVPFVVRWPGKVKAGSSSDQTICHVDLMATCAQVLDVKLPENAGEDSVSILPALLGTASGPLREATVHHSINGSFAIRQGKWKLCLCPGSGGWSAPRPGKEDTSALPLVQLFDLSSDIGETKNVQAEHPEVVEQLTKLLEKYVSQGRSTAGAVQKNAVEVDMWKAGKAAHRAGKKK